jgi:hypothetical protein
MRGVILKINKRGKKMTTTGYMFESGPMHMAQSYDATSVNWLDDIIAGKIKAILTNNAPAAHYTDWDHYDDVTGELGSASGYTAGGQTLTGGTLTVITDTDRYLKYGADNLVWPAAFTAGPFRYIVFLKNTGVASTSPLICYHDLGVSQTGLGGAFEYDFTALGGVFRQKIPHSP